MRCTSLLLSALGLWAWAGGASAEPARIQALLSCRAEAAPGRVLCELRFRAPAGSRIVWADALVTEAPEFARPLRARVSPERFGAASPGERTVNLAFVAAVPGAGQVTVQARAVGCRGQGDQERCRPETQAVTAELRVGS